MLLQRPGKERTWQINISKPHMLLVTILKKVPKQMQETNTQLRKLQRLQNAATRPVSNVAKYDHITPTPVNLHWPPVTYRVNFKIAMLTHKCIYGNVPEYLKDLIKVKSTTRYNLRSDGEMLLEDYSARSKKTLGDRTFKVAAPRIWNILPKDIRKQDNYYIVNKQLKTYYFKLAYHF